MIQQLVDRYKAGEYTTKLSKEYGISKSGLLDLLVAEGVSFRKQPMTEEATKRAIQLYESGLSINEVVDKVGYSYGTIRRALHMNDVAVRPKGIKRRLT